MIYKKNTQREKHTRANESKATSLCDTRIEREREYQAYQVCILYASRTLVINKTENRVV